MPLPRTRRIPTAEEARAALSYDPETGVFRRLMWRGLPCDRPVGFVHKDGYRYINLSRTMELEHRLAWLMAHGEWPALYVDHINGDRSDNRIANLRLATPLQSSRNAGPHKGSKSGIRGVKPSGRKWTAQAAIDGVYRHLGTFDTPEAARAAYERETTARYGEFVRKAA